MRFHSKCTGVVCHFLLHWPCIPVYMVVHVLLEYSGPKWPLGGGDIFRQKELAMRKCGDRTFLVWGIGEGNGNPLQYSCLENPMDGGAW